MSDMQYAVVNTTIRLKEKELLTTEQYDSFLKATSLESALRLLKSTVYHDLDDRFNEQLLKHLANVYNELMAITPNTAVIELFSLVYTYHNVKVLLKEKLLGSDLRHCLVPIGSYAISDLEHFIKTGHSERLPHQLTLTITETVKHFETFQQVASIDILMDKAYFQHVYDLAKHFQDDIVLKIVTAWIDVYNVSVVTRLKKMSISRSLLVSVLVDNGEIATDTLLASDYPYELLTQTSYAEAVNNADFLGVSVGALKERITHYYLQDSKYHAFGHLPLLAYVFYKEMDIKNLTLLLTGKDNGIDEMAIRERMKPIYEL